MKLLAKFNIAFLLVFGGGLTAAGLLAGRFLKDNAQEQVLRQASLMMETALAARTYTTEQLKPLLETPQHFTTNFIRQTVPAYAASETFRYLRKRYPDYTYREATLNPTNPSNRAVDWEADIINIFRNHRDRTDLHGTRDTPDGMSLYMARPILVGAPCLACHSVPARAPRSMIKLYGTANGFGWQTGEIVGAQIVSVPLSLPMAIAQKAFQTLMIYLGAVGIATMIILDIALVLVVIRPVRRLSAVAEDISKGNLDIPELTVRGRDEIAGLAGSFNRMYVSLRKAIQLLEGR